VLYVVNANLDFVETCICIEMGRKVTATAPFCW